MSSTSFSPDLVIALPAGSTLAAFNQAGVLSAADVHVALRLGRLAGEADERVLLAAALAVRAPRYGHVLVDLSSVSDGLAGLDQDEATVDVEALPWPDARQWSEAVASSPLVAAGDDFAGPRPLRLIGNALYLARHWDEERLVADALLQRATAPPLDVDEDALGRGLSLVFPGQEDGEQAGAVALALRHRLAVVAGGPGTGKTTTIARFLALAYEQALAAGRRPPVVALAAPTGKAAARMAEAVRREAGQLPVGDEVRGRLLSVEASTVHRLLGRHPGTANRFRHDRHELLPHDIVVVDETSMMSLSLMASLLEAVPPEARLVLLGDPQQLASVEAGSVLGDIVGLAVSGPVAGCTCVLRANHRFAGPLAQLAQAVSAGHADEVMAVLGAGAGPVLWLPVEAQAGDAELVAVRDLVIRAARSVGAAAGNGDADAALAAAGQVKVLCAHREGPAGATTWNARVEQWLAADDALAEMGAACQPGQWYAGRPVVVTANDYSAGLFNGDLGVTVVRPGGGLGAVFAKPGGATFFSPSRLSTVQTAYAMTAHRAQGSELDDVVVVLPDASSPVLTRELLYTAVTRARHRLVLVGTEETTRAAVGRPVARASGLATRLSALS